MKSERGKKSRSQGIREMKAEATRRAINTLAENKIGYKTIKIHTANWQQRARAGFLPVRGSFPTSICMINRMLKKCKPVIEEAHVVPRRILTIKWFLVVLHLVFFRHLFKQLGRELVTRCGNEQLGRELL